MEQEIKERGWHNWPNLFKFEGKKEIYWIVLMVLLLLTVWGYVKDREICREYIQNPCEMCAIKTQNTQYEHPSLLTPDLEVEINEES